MQAFSFIRSNQILMALAVLGIIYLAYQLASVLAVLLVAIIVASTVLPAVDFLERHKIPRSVAVVAILIAMVAGLAFIIFGILQSVAEDIGSFAQQIPEHLNALESQYAYINTEGLRRVAQDTATSIVSNSATVIGGLFTSLVVAAYLEYTWYRLRAGILKRVPQRTRRSTDKFLTEATSELGAWFRGQLIVASAVGVLIYLGLLVLGIPHAGVLGASAAVLEFVPYFGSVAASIPAILIALSDSWTLALITAGLYLAVNQLESYVLLPWVMGRQVQLHPLAVILVVLIGFTLGGILGALLAVPIATLARAAVHAYRDYATGE